MYRIYETNILKKFEFNILPFKLHSEFLISNLWVCDGKEILKSNSCRKSKFTLRQDRDIGPDLLDGKANYQ